MVHACMMLPNLQVYKYVSISWWEAPLLVPEHEHAKRSPQRLWMPGRIYLIHHRPGGWWQASPFNWFVFCQKFARSTGVQMLTHYHVFKTCLAWKFRPVHLEELLLWNGEVHFTGGFQGCVQWGIWSKASAALKPNSQSLGPPRLGRVHQYVRVRVSLCFCWRWWEWRWETQLKP